MHTKTKWPLAASVPTTKGHFWSFLISNIFCDPLFHRAAFSVPSHVQTKTPILYFFNKNTVVDAVTPERRNIQLCFFDLYRILKKTLLASRLWFSSYAPIFKPVWCTTPYTFSTDLFLRCTFDDLLSHTKGLWWFSPLVLPHFCCRVFWIPSVLKISFAQPIGVYLFLLCVLDSLYIENLTHSAHWSVPHEKYIYFRSLCFTFCSVFWDLFSWPWKFFL